MKPFRAFLRNSVLEARLAAITDEAQTDWLRDLGKNDFVHSQNIEAILDRLVPDRLKANEEVFSQGEVFLLLVAVYLHDIGRRQGDEHHELQTYQMILDDPAGYRLKNEFEAKAVAQICAAHGPEEDWPLEKCDDAFGLMELSPRRPLNLRRLGALLRIADELENTYLRVRGVRGHETSPRQLISDIEPVPSKLVIQIHAHPKTWADWLELEQVKDYTETRVRHASAYLSDIGLDYYQVCLKKPDTSIAKLRPPKPQARYEDLVQSVAMLLEQRYVNVDVCREIEGVELGVYCEANNLGLITRIGVIATSTLDADRATESVGALSYLVGCDRIHKGIIVVENIPDEAVCRIATDRGFPVVSLARLALTEAGFKPALEKYVRRYEQEDFTKRDLFVEPTLEDESGRTVGPALTSIRSWLDSPEGVQLTLLGEFGSGKTTLCRHIVYRLAREWLECPEAARIPILIDLKRMAATSSIESVVADVFLNDLDLSLSYSSFEAFNKAGMFALFLDGFDEISNLYTETAVLRAFRQIDRLVAHGSKVVMTCRTHFFKDNEQIHRLHAGSVLYASVAGKYGYDLWFLRLFDPGQVAQYLAKWAGSEAPKYHEMIDRLYGLADLARRPVLLNMIVTTIPQIDAGAVQSLNAATLYETYISFWLKRDDWRSILDIDDRRALAICVAEFLFSSERDRVHYSEIPGLLRDWGYADPRLDPNALDYELRTCNFLRSTPQGWYDFVHKSFLEYILARHFCDELFEGEGDLAISWVLPCEQTRRAPGRLRVAPREVEDFVIQIASPQLMKIGDQAATERFRSRKRSREVAHRIIRASETPGFGRFYAELLYDCREGNREHGDSYAEMFWQAENWPEAVSHLVTLINNGDDLNQISRAIMWLESKAPRGADESLGRLRKALDEREAWFEGRIKEETGISDYPYLRAKRQEMLDAAKRAAEAEQEEFSKDVFLRHWYRQKDEYDRRVRRSKDQPTEREIVSEHIVRDLERKDRKESRKRSKRSPRRRP